MAVCCSFIPVLGALVVLSTPLGVENGPVYPPHATTPAATIQYTTMALDRGVQATGFQWDAVMDDLQRGGSVTGTTPTGATLLHMAAGAGEVAAVEALLAIGALVDATDGGGRTPLFLATKAGHGAVVRALAEAGASLDIPGPGGATPLSLAVEGSQWATVGFLLAHGADGGSVIGVRGLSALHLAAIMGDAVLAQWLLAAGLDPNAADDDGHTPLYFAAGAGNVALVELLLAAGASPTIPDELGITPLVEAFRSGAVPVVERLVEAGAAIPTGGSGAYAVVRVVVEEGGLPAWTYLTSKAPGLVEGFPGVSSKGHLGPGGTTWSTSKAPGSKASKKRPLGLGKKGALSLGKKGAPTATVPYRDTLLVKAARHDQWGIVIALLDAGADAGVIEEKAVCNPKHPGKSFVCYESALSPLHLAARGGSLEAVEALVAHGADIGAVNGVYKPALGLGASVLREATSSGSLSVVQLLVSKGADPAGESASGQGILQGAAESGSAELVEWLLDHGVGVDTADEGGVTPLEVAIDVGSLAMVELLLAKGASLTSEPTLHRAIAAGDHRIVELLINEGAPLATKDQFGRTPLHLAASHGDVFLASYLVAAGVEIDGEGNYGATALHEAAYQGSLPLVSLLLDAGASADSLTTKGESPLVYAATGQHWPIVALLLPTTGKAALDAPNGMYGMTALHFAAKGGSVETVKLLLTKGADTTLLDAEGKTAEDYADASGIPGLGALFPSEGATPTP